MSHFWNIILLCFFISMVPALESRFAIPFAVGMGIDPEEALLTVLVGNSLAIPLAIFLVSLLDRFILNLKGKHLKKISSLYERISYKAADRVKGKMENWGYIGLLLFVAIPLPGSGVWTGALAAQILRLKRGKTGLALLGGQTIAAFMMFLMVKGALYTFFPM